MVTCICIIIVSILLIIYSIYQSVVAEPRKQALVKHHELSWKLTNKGSETNSLKTAKECLYTLSRSYENIKGHVNANSRFCYEDDIELIRSNAECLAEDEWDSKAQKFLLRMDEAHSMIVDHDFSNVDKAYKQKAVFLKAYDDYFDWTRECYENNRIVWKDINIWEVAKNGIISILGYECGYLFWNSDEQCKHSVRKQIEENLTKHIESMRPEYLRKIKLKSLILQRIADHESIQRSVLLKSDFSGFVDEEIRACYRGIVRDHDIIEVKQGNVYFVSLSDESARKYTPNPNNDKMNMSAGKDGYGIMIAPMTKLLYRELIRHFDEEGIDYVDKTVSGGSLYFFSDTEAESLKKKGYPVMFAEKGTKGTDHRPAWYIKI